MNKKGYPSVFFFFHFCWKLHSFWRCQQTGFHKKKRKYCWTQKDYDHETNKAQFGNLPYENAWPQKKKIGKRKRGWENQFKELTFESRLWSSLWRLMGHAHKSLPVGMVCHQMNTPSLAHPQALPLHTIITTYRWAILLYPKLESETIPICHQKPSINTGKKKHSALIARNKSIQIWITNKPICRNSSFVD